ncbi:Nitrogen permease regulator 2 [Paecilomyces lecythidis]|uniref:Nitrogen permease regulator 2 n=1 Tax=Paecilomyces lecythidis TaxID=3004212 RepID=A0ABR3Y0T7_9EURO
MIKAIFYSKFDTQEGPKVVHQVPDGAIVPSVTAPTQDPFLTFSDISFFVIPRQELCGNLLQVCTGGYRILGYPICMKSPRYDRNEFIFNFCVVLAEEEDFTTYKSVVQKLADLMHGLEEQSGFLSRDHSKSGEGKVYSLCETLMEDLNNYCECMIPIDELNTLNVKLFPIYPAPPHVKAWQVPLFTVRYQTFMDENWDLTMQRIVPHINGVNSIRIISILADAEFSLTCRAIRHLLYYGCIFLLDIFSFSAIYAPTAQFSSTIAVDEDMQRECARYVNTRFAPVPFSLRSPSTGTATGHVASSHRSDIPGTHASVYSHEDDDIWPFFGGSDGISKGSASNNAREIVDGVGIVELYASLQQGQSVKQWYAQHSQQLANIDVRRFITFGIIKGFLYRVHKYAYATGFPAPAVPPNTATATPATVSLHGGISSNASSVPTDSFTSASGLSSSIHSNDTSHHIHNDSIPSSFSRIGGHPRSASPALYSRSHEDDDEDDYIDDRTLSKYLDGVHCFDQICTELEISEKELMSRLKRYPGEVQIIHR